MDRSSIRSAGRESGNNVPVVIGDDQLDRITRCACPDHLRAHCIDGGECSLNAEVLTQERRLASLVRAPRL